MQVRKQGLATQVLVTVTANLKTGVSGAHVLQLVVVA
jgi:hypothetical protein